MVPKPKVVKPEGGVPPMDQAEEAKANSARLRSIFFMADSIGS
jgi:hypothetical protein